MQQSRSLYLKSNPLDVSRIYAQLNPAEIPITSVSTNFRPITVLPSVCPRGVYANRRCARTNIVFRLDVQIFQTSGVTNRPGRCLHTTSRERRIGALCFNFFQGVSCVNNVNVAKWSKRCILLPLAQRADRIMWCVALTSMPIIAIYEVRMW